MDDLKKYRQILDENQQLANPQYGISVPGSNYDFYRTLLSVFGDGNTEQDFDNGILYAQNEQEFKFIKKLLKKAGIKHKTFGNLQNKKKSDDLQTPGNTLSPYPGNKSIR